MTDPGRLAAEKLRAKPSGEKMNLESELTDVKIIMPTGNEIPAKIVLRDRDLDLAFVQPTEKQERRFPSIDVQQTATPQLLDDIFVLYRLGKAAGRVLSVTPDRVQAILSKPRQLFLPHLSRELGAPAFSTDGKWIGSVLLRIVRSTDANAGAMVVVLPAADILDIARQVPGMEQLGHPQ